MASVTGIELGRESCVLAGVRASGPGTADVMALHIIEPAAWPTLDVALVETLRSVRRGKRFPRNARIVAWGLPDDPAGNEATVRALQRPIVAAGFRVESILTPPQALALLAASRQRQHGDGAAAWLALNMHGAAIAIVRGGELLFARTFEWSYSTRVMSGKAQLLQRYSLVAQLAPEVRRGIAAVRASRGIVVEQAVTCGDLPELRSLTMPLIEELDLEVETLDSTEGLRAVGKAKAERFAESAPAIRLACAAALTQSKRRGSANKSFARVAAGIAVVAALGLGQLRVLARIDGAYRDSAQSDASPDRPPLRRALARRRRAPARRQAPPAAHWSSRRDRSLRSQSPGSCCRRTPQPRRPVGPGAIHRSPQSASRSGTSGSSRSVPAPATSPAPAPPKPTVIPPAKVEPKPAVMPPAKAEPKPTAIPPVKVDPKPTTVIPPKVDPKPIAKPPVAADPKTTRAPIAPPPVPRVEPKPDCHASGDRGPEVDANAGCADNGEVRTPAGPEAECDSRNEGRAACGERLITESRTACGERVIITKSNRGRRRRRQPLAWSRQRPRSRKPAEPPVPTASRLVEPPAESHCRDRSSHLRQARRLVRSQRPL